MDRGQLKGLMRLFVRDRPKDRSCPPAARPVPPMDRPKAQTSLPPTTQRRLGNSCGASLEPLCEAGCEEGRLPFGALSERPDPQPTSSLLPWISTANDARCTTSTPVRPRTANLLEVHKKTLRGIKVRKKEWVEVLTRLSGGGLLSASHHGGDNGGSGHPGDGGHEGLLGSLGLGGLLGEPCESSRGVHGVEGGEGKGRR